jgi:hypothetical protein
MKSRYLRLGNGLKVKLVVSKDAVAFEYGDEFVSYYPSLKRTGLISGCDRSSVLFKTTGEAWKVDFNGNHLAV